MNKKLFFPAVYLLLLAACNNSGKESENKSDSTAKSNDTSHHMPLINANVPALPDIPEGAKVFFKNLKNNATVRSPFKVEMGTKIMKVDTAGPIEAGSGHHHLLVDAEDFVVEGNMVPKDSTHLHFGKGQTETELKLAPGKHKLTLQFADGMHRSYGSKLTSTIMIRVKK